MAETMMEEIKESLACKEQEGDIKSVVTRMELILSQLHTSNGQSLVDAIEQLQGIVQSYMQAVDRLDGLVRRRLQLEEIREQRLAVVQAAKQAHEEVATDG